MSLRVSPKADVAISFSSNYNLCPVEIQNRRADKKDCQGERKGDLGSGPAVDAHQRALEDAPTVNASQNYLHYDTRRCYFPSLFQEINLFHHGLTSLVLFVFRLDKRDRNIIIQKTLFTKKNEKSGMTGSAMRCVPV